MAHSTKNEVKAALRERFINAIEQLQTDDPALKKQDIAKRLGISSPSISEILNLRQQPTIDILQRLFAEFKINPQYIFFDQLPIKLGNTPVDYSTESADMVVNEAPAQYESSRSVTENVTPTVTPTPKKDKKTPELIHLNGGNTGNTYNLGAPHVVTVNERGEENIIYVPVKARAGYLNGFGDPEYIASLPSYRMPGLTNGTYRMFEVEGPSMAPNIQHGDRVIGQWVDKLSEIAQNRVYVVVTKNGVIVKRLLNRLDQRGKIVIKSDTITHRGDYPTIEIDPEEILELWYCRLKLSSDFSEPAEIYHRVADLEADMVDVKRIINHFGPQLPPIEPKN